MEWLAGLLGGIFGESFWEDMPWLAKLVFGILILGVIVLVVLVATQNLPPEVGHFFQQLFSTTPAVEVLAHDVPDGVVVEVHANLAVEMLGGEVELITNQGPMHRPIDQFPSGQPMEVHFPISSPAEPELVIVRLFAQPGNELVFEQEFPFQEIVR